MSEKRPRGMTVCSTALYARRSFFSTLHLSFSSFSFPHAGVHILTMLRNAISAATRPAVQAVCLIKSYFVLESVTHVSVYRELLLPSPRASPRSPREYVIYKINIDIILSPFIQLPTKYGGVYTVCIESPSYPSSRCNNSKRSL